MKLSGGCACESIRYECTEEPIVQVICHCRACQRASGSAFAAIMMVAADRISFFERRARIPRGHWRDNTQKIPSRVLREVRQSADITLA